MNDHIDSGDSTNITPKPEENASPTPPNTPTRIPPASSTPPAPMPPTPIPPASSAPQPPPVSIEPTAPVTPTRIPPAAQADPVPPTPVPPPPPPAEPEPSASPMDLMGDIEIPAELDKEVAAALAAEMSGVSTSSSPDTTADGKFEPGKEVTGTVVNISEDDIFIEFGPKSQGVLPRNQFGKKETVEPGRRIDVVVERYDEETGLLILARKGAIQRATWANLSKGMIVEGRATGVVKSGLELDVQGIRAFMPLSQISIIPMKDTSVLLNQKVRCVVLEVNARKKNLLVSRRKVLEIEAKESKEKLLTELEAGQTRKGIVRSLTEYGAFVDLGGIDGLLHVSDMSWSRVNKPGDVVEVGQEIEVSVVKIDTERGRISLSLKETTPDPWAGVSDRFPAGTSVKARVVRLASFGAFAEVESGVEGLIPISEMSWSRIRTSNEAVREGDMVDTVVIRVEQKDRRIALSMKQAQKDPWAEVLESFPAQSLVTGKVTRLTDFGAFVEIVSGVEGLIHISELSTEHVKACSDVVKEGQEIETRVLGVDLENRRISLSIKAVKVQEVTAEQIEAIAQEPAKPPKKRKKPLRGGLSSHYNW